MRGVFQLYVILVLVLLQAFPCDAKKKEKNGLKRVPPKFLLVQLSTETNRLEALIKAGRYGDTAILMQDMRAVRNNTVKDFSRNFKYCPVYFYDDVNQDAIMAKQFDGVLMDSSLKTVKHLMDIADTNYLIVYYGFPGWQSGKGSMQVTNMTDMGGKPNGWGLVVNNHEMKQVGYNYWLWSVNMKKDPNYMQYKYVSEKFEIEYYPLAADLNIKLRSYAAKYARKQRENAAKEAQKR